MADDKSIPFGFCHCGCGQRTRVPKWNCSFYGYKSGVPLRYVRGHNQRRCTQTPDHRANIARANTGKRHSEATKRLLSERLEQHPRLTGPANYQWKDGKAASRRGRLGLAWSRAVKRRDAFTCRHCEFVSHNKKGLHAHHVRSFADAPELRFDVSNGITLCAVCHFKIHHPDARVPPKWGSRRVHLASMMS